MQLTLGFIATGMGVALLPSSIRRLHRDGVVYRPVQPSGAVLVLAIAWLQSHSKLKNHIHSFQSYSVFD